MEPNKNEDRAQKEKGGKKKRLFGFSVPKTPIPVSEPRAFRQVAHVDSSDNFSGTSCNL